MMTIPIRFRALALVLATMAAACAPGRPRGAPEAEAFTDAVEVTNNLERPVDVRYRDRGQAEHFLGTVSPGGRQRFVLPTPAIQVFATDPSQNGALVRTAPNRVDIRRIPAPGS